jgi:hypothetical protein
MGILFFNIACAWFGNKGVLFEGSSLHLEVDLGSGVKEKTENSF